MPKTARDTSKYLRDNVPKGWLVGHPFFTDRPVLQRRAVIANNYSSPNAITIECHKNFNGSGPDHFGGAKEWPHLTIRIGFPVDSEDQRDKLAVKLAKFLDGEI